MVRLILYQVNEDGAAARDGRLKPGQRILEVSTHSQTIDACGGFLLTIKSILYLIFVFVVAET